VEQSKTRNEHGSRTQIALVFYAPVKEYSSTEHLSDTDREIQQNKHVLWIVRFFCKTTSKSTTTKNCFVKQEADDRTKKQTPFC
jgi:hypothetical protein